MCDEILGNVHLKTASLAQNDLYPLPNESFDLAVSNYVVEHVDDARRHLSEIKRVLRPGGCYLFRTPNLLHATSPWQRFKVDTTDTKSHLLLANPLRRLASGSHEPWPTVYAMNTPAAVRRHAGDVGFEVEQMELVEKEPSYGMYARPLFLTFMAYERLVNASPRLAPLRANLFVVLRKSNLDGTTSMLGSIGKPFDRSSGPPDGDVSLMAAVAYKADTEGSGPRVSPEHHRPLDCNPSRVADRPRSSALSTLLFAGTVAAVNKYYGFLTAICGGLQAAIVALLVTRYARVRPHRLPWIEFVFAVHYSQFGLSVLGGPGEVGLLRMLPRQESYDFASALALFSGHLCQMIIAFALVRRGVRRFGGAGRFPALGPKTLTGEGKAAFADIGRRQRHPLWPSVRDDS